MAIHMLRLRIVYGDSSSLILPQKWQAPNSFFLIALTPILS